MEEQKAAPDDYKIFAFFALFWVMLGWLAFVLALAGFFHGWIFAVYFILGAAVSIYAIFAKKSLLKISREMIAASLALLVIVIFLSSFTEPAIFSGRDQGSISEAAIRLSQNHELKFSTAASGEFFKIYGPGRALNFPGFYYTSEGSLITQFPIPYTAWLAIFYSLFGLPGLVIANAILLFLFLFSFYLLIRLFADNIFSFLAVLIFAASFPVFWFFKLTLSECLALALVWLGILQVMLFLKEKGSINLYALMLTFGLLIFTRIEGFAIFAMLLGIMILSKNLRASLAPYAGRIYAFIFFLFVILAAAIFVNLPFFKEIGKALIAFLPKVGNGSAGNIFSSFLYPAGILAIYRIAPYVIIGFVGIFYFARRKDYSKLIPLLLVLPTFFYFFDSNISSDHPWMLRRYIFAVIPALFLYSVLFFYSRLGKNRKKLLYAVIIALFLFNIPLFAKYAFFSENRGLIAQTEKISASFSNNDLVLVDRLASGDGWSMLSGPMNFLYGKQSVYFLNPNDLAEIDIDKFGKIYLIASQENIAFYENSDWGRKMIYRQDYALETTRLDISSGSLRLPEKKRIIVEGKIFEIVR